MILVIDNYDSFTYNIVQAIQTLGEEVIVYRNDAVSLEKIDDLCPDGIVISPGPGTPDRAGISVEAIRKFEDRIPILGVCLGHQCAGAAYRAELIAGRKRHPCLSRSFIRFVRTGPDLRKLRP